MNSLIDDCQAPNDAQTASKRPRVGTATVTNTAEVGPPGVQRDSAKQDGVGQRAGRFRAFQDGDPADFRPSLTEADCPDRIALRIEEVAAALGVSRRTIERERAAGRFPQPARFIGRMPLWGPKAIRDWFGGVAVDPSPRNPSSEPRRSRPAGAAGPGTGPTSARRETRASD